MQCYKRRTCARHVKHDRAVVELRAFVCRGRPAAIVIHRCPAETPDDSNSNAVVNNIQALYLAAVQEANRRPNPRIVEASAEPVTEKPQGAASVRTAPELSRRQRGAPNSTTY
jgi:hypothetical protein